MTKKFQIEMFITSKVIAYFRPGVQKIPVAKYVRDFFVCRSRVKIVMVCGLLIIKAGG